MSENELAAALARLQERHAALQVQHAALQEQHAVLQDEHNEAINKIAGLEALVALMNLRGKEINRQAMQACQDNRELRRKLAQRAECYRRQMDALWEDVSAQLGYARSRIAGLQARLGLNKGEDDAQSSHAFELVPRNMPRI